MNASNRFYHFTLGVFILMCACSTFAQSNASTGTRTIVIFFDGLRPDYITEETMPNLFAFSKAGCYARQHHSVYPTVTRVNASSYSSGGYPATHGLLENTVYIPAVDRVRTLNTGNYDDLRRINEGTNGHLLTSVTLGEVLAKHGHRMMVFSSGSAGQALMQNHTVNSGAIVNPQLILPESFRETVVRALGPIPAKGAENALLHRWITDAWIKFGIADDGPLVSSIWYSDPDGTAHDEGIGAATSMASIRAVDAEFGRIVAELKARNVLDKFNVIVSTDHGFVTHAGKTDLEEFLIAKGIKKSNLSDDVIIAGGAIYVAHHNETVIKDIVTALQQEDWIGALFTRGEPGSLKGRIAGTLSFESIHWDHKTRAADILVDNNWNDNKNEYGYPGTSLSQGVAGHGGLSPYEVHIALLADGPAFKDRFSSEWPTSNVDLAPTILAIHRLVAPEEMDGRVAEELLEGRSPMRKKPRVEKTIVKASIPEGTYQLTLQRTVLGRWQYVDKVTTVRIKK